MKIIVQENHHLTKPEKHVVEALAATVRKDLQAIAHNTCASGVCPQYRQTTVRLIVEKNKLSSLSIKIDACCQQLRREIESKLYLEELI